ncbi:MAG: hypothetical protein IT557_15875 [Alphaproteobacteria bacterium]|nr:hypothetical protein [Alphaproteobacteria bacterium]
MNGAAALSQRPGKAAAGPAAAAADAARLLALLAEARANALARRVLYLRTSLVSAESKRAHHLRLAAELLSPVREAGTGTLFALPNDDLVLVWRRGADAELAEARAQLDFLFAADAAIGRDPVAAGALHRLFALPADAEALAALVQAVMAQARPGPAAAPPDDATPPGLASVPLPPAGGAEIQALERIERALAQADIEACLRRQSIAAFDGQGAPVPQWQECFVSIADLAQRLQVPDMLTGDPWLFRRLTLSLDRRVLSHLAQPGALAGADGLALNLNLATLLGPDFPRFDAALPAGLRGRIVLELQRADIFADLDAFLFARDFARARGYRLCLDGLTHHALPLVSRARLGFDLAKLLWTGDLAGTPADKALAHLPDKAERAAIVLCRCESEAAIDWGRQRGFSLFQGRAVERLLSVGAGAHRA